MEDLECIWFKGIFWIKIKPYLLSFGWNGLPKNIHYTLAFNENSDSVNLHLTKEKTEESEKMNLRLVEIKKTEIEGVTNYVGKRMLGSILKSLDIGKFRLENRNKIGFISYEHLQGQVNSEVIEKKFSEAFAQITKRANKQIKIKGGQNIIGEKLESVALSSEMRRILKNNIKPVYRHFHGPFIEGGMLISRKETKQVIRFDQTWFEIQMPQDLTEFLSKITNPKIAANFLERNKIGLDTLCNAKTSSDLEKLGKPINLFMIKNSKEKSPRETKV